MDTHTHNIQVYTLLMGVTNREGLGFEAITLYSCTFDMVHAAHVTPLLAIVG